MQMEVTSDVIDWLAAQARAAHPRECCGILLGHEGRIREARATANVHPAPETHFEIDPQALIDAHRAARSDGAPQVLGYYHSHPGGNAVPSATDRASAAGDGRIWAIIAGAEVRFWRDCKGGFEALSYSLADG